MNVRVAALVFLFACTSLFAQVKPVAPPAVTPEVMLPSPEQAPEPSARELKVFEQSRPLTVAENVTSTGPNGELWLDVPPIPFGSGVLLRALPATPNIFAALGVGSPTSSFQVTEANGSTLFKVGGDGSSVIKKGSMQTLRTYPNGYVAINPYLDTTYNARLFVSHDEDNSTTLFVNRQPRFFPGDPTQNDYGLFVQAHNIMQPGGASNTNGSMTGIYATSWLTGPGFMSTTYGQVIEAGTYAYGGGSLAATLTNSIGLDLRVIRATDSTITNGYALFIRNVAATNDFAVFQEGADDGNYFAGNVGIGTMPTTRKLEVAGDANFSGTVTGANINAHYQDLAEWVPATTDMEPGTVVVLNHDKTNEVMASHRPYDTSVAGVVSAKPGVLLGVAGESKEQVATTGRVKVRVDARLNPIRVGDLLVTSDVPGTAMKSAPVDLDGIALHRPGTIIGKALEPLSGGVGEILVLLSLQ